MSISPEEVELAAGFVERNLPILIDYGKHFLKGANSQIRRRLPNTYQKYLATAAARYGRTKSFFIRDEPSSIYDFYVPLSASIGERKIKKADISKLQDISSLCVITGSAGSGKSVFMRHLFLSAINEGGKVPVFVELRDLNEDEFTVFDLILQSLKRNEFDLGSEYIRSALNDGHFLLLLDGYDEIDLLHRKKASKEILNISKMGKNISVFVSSRPDDVFSGWDNFSIAQLSPLTLEEASDLVEKLPYDDDIKKKFSIDLNKTLYVRHRSFLSNPLLLSIMLLTYGTSADIPNKLSIFYNLAYEALFQRHDALKGGYKREIRCHLDIQDFGRVFSAFSVSTYNKRQFRFSRMDALSAINKAITVTGIKVDSEKFLDDALQSVCLLIEDGLFIVFAHRSFQEYFVSKYISEQNEENQEMLIEKFWRNIEVDNVLNLLYEISPDIIERKLFIPKLKIFFNNIGVTKNTRKIGITHFTKYLKSEFSRIHFDNAGKAAISLTHTGNNPRYSSLISMAINCTSPSFIKNEREKYDMRKEMEKFSKKYGKKLEYPLKNLSYKSQIIKDFYELPGFYSKRYLEEAFDIKNTLERKHKNPEKFLNILLSS